MKNLKARFAKPCLFNIIMQDFSLIYLPKSVPPLPSHSSVWLILANQRNLVVFGLEAMAIYSATTSKVWTTWLCILAEFSKVKMTVLDILLCQIIQFDT